MADTRTDVLLYGHLRKRFGRRYQLAVDTPYEAVQALSRMVPGFEAHVLEHSLPGYRVLVDDSPRDETTYNAPLGGAKVIKIVPVVAGAKDAFTRIIIGAALIYFSGGSAWGAAGSFGASAGSAMTGIGWAMVLGGVSQLLTSQPGVGVDTPNGKEGLPTYTFGSPTVTIGQGRPIPVYLGGPGEIGGAVVSSGVTSEAYQPKGFGGAAPDDLGTRGGNGDTVPYVWAIQPQGS